MTIEMYLRYKTLLFPSQQQKETFNQAKALGWQIPDFPLVAIPILIIGSSLTGFTILFHSAVKVRKLHLGSEYLVTSAVASYIGGLVYSAILVNDYATHKYRLYQEADRYYATSRVQESE